MDHFRDEAFHTIDCTDIQKVQQLKQKRQLLQRNHATLDLSRKFVNCCKTVRKIAHDKPYSRQ